MTESTDRLPEVARRDRVAHLRPLLLILTALAAILFQVYVPLFFQYLTYLELPLLVAVYYALMSRGPLAGLFFGAGIGLVQDSLSHQPLGMFGIVKTLVGYFVASVSQRFDVENPAVRLILAFIFFFFHQFLHWVLTRALLGQQLEFDVQQNLMSGVLNSAVALPLFRILDKLKETG